jgi:CBS domain-containing protein
MALFRFERVVNQVYEEKYRGKFSIHINRYAPDIDIYMRAEVPDPNGGPGFLGVVTDMTIRFVLSAPHLRVRKKMGLRVRVPSFTASVWLRHNDFVFRDAIPVRHNDDPYYDTAAFIDVDKEYKLGDMNPSTIFNYKYLVNRYAIWGERKWCRAALTPDQAFRSVDDVRAKKNDFMKLRTMLEVVAALFNDKVATELKHGISMNMITHQGYACRVIASKKVHTLYGDYPLVEKMLLARTLTGRRAMLSNHEILSLVNKRPYATLIENRIAKIAKMQR